MDNDSLAAEEGIGMNIYVGNLSVDVTEDELRQEFMAFGQVQSVTIMEEKFSRDGESRGYGFVEMPSKPEGEAAISNLQGKSLNGKIIDVIAALPLSAKRDTAYIHSKRGRRPGSHASYRRY